MKASICMLLVFLSFKLFAQQDVTFDLQNRIEPAYDGCLLKLVEINSNQLYSLDSMRKFQVIAAFPVSENGVHKYVYWRYDLLPRVFATVYFDMAVNRQTARYDGTIRDFTPKEAFAFRMVQAVKRDIEADPFFKKIPNAYLTVMPVIEQNSYHVYVTWDAREARMLIFGNDYEYEFDENSVMLSKKRNHSTVSYVCDDSISDDSPTNRIEFHNHENEAEPGFSGTCLMSVYTFSSMMKWKMFYFTDQTHVYCLDLLGGKMLKSTLEEFEKRNLFGLKPIVK